MRSGVARLFWRGRLPVRLVAQRRSVGALGRRHRPTVGEKQKSPPRPEPGGRRAGGLMLLGVNSIRSLPAFRLERLDGVTSNPALQNPTRSRARERTTHLLSREIFSSAQ
jgi:hypothetical protein